MKITIESEYEIQSVDFKNMDVDIDQIVRMIRGMLCGLEYPEIDRHFMTNEELEVPVNDAHRCSCSDNEIE